jgi:hypothetical protein
MEQYIQLGYLCKIWRQDKLTGEQRADAWKPKNQRVFGIFSGVGSLGIGAECEKENNLRVMVDAFTTRIEKL